MTQQPQTDIAAPCVQGGSETVFFRLQDLPDAARGAGEARDRFLLRAVGKRTVDIAIVARSLRPGTDVDYLQGRIAGEDEAIDWSGNCCTLSAAVASFALSGGFVHRERIPRTSAAAVRLRQANIGKSIVATMPIPTAGVRLEFIDPAVQAGKGSSAIFPTGYLIDELEVPGVGWLQATLINAGAPTMFIDAAAIGHTGTEPPEAIEGKAEALALLEQIRACGAVRMGLIEDAGDPARRQHLPAIVLVAPPADYLSAQGQRIGAAAVDLLARPVAPGRPCRSMPETAVVATAAAAAIPGTLASLATGGRAHGTVRLGHASGVVCASADARQIGGEWIVVKVVVDGCAPRASLEMTHSD
jgi:2-methylaconitate cis-trans-isomerase PrpF